MELGVEVYTIGKCIYSIVISRIIKLLVSNILEVSECFLYFDNCHLVFLVSQKRDTIHYQVCFSKSTKTFTSQPIVILHLLYLKYIIFGIPEPLQCLKGKSSSEVGLHQNFLTVNVLFHLNGLGRVLYHHLAVYILKI
jgi:hypothetical protein